MTVGYLVDKSALARWDEASVAGVLGPALAAGLLWSCPPVDLEVLFSAQSPAEYFSVRDDRGATYSHAPLVDEIGVTALELQASLARAGQLRAVGPIDLLIAATAVAHGLTVLHYDRDFEILATADARLAHQWVVPRGSVD
ncbi:MAG: PIN domain-containing protein [Acidimicrobiales bacterium]